MRWALAPALALAAAIASAADDPDEAALALADKTDAQAKTASDWRVSIEAALNRSSPRAGGPDSSQQQLSLDSAYDKRIAPHWRAVFANRLDLVWRGGISEDNFVDTLKEAYASWQPHPERIVDLGRVNLRYGVAAGYNPTDYFRAGALRSVLSIDPASLRENRLGSVMLRGQTLWAGGSLAALYSPKLAEQPNDSPFSPDFGATNNRNRWLLAASQKLADDVNPQLLLYGAQHDSPQIGVNLTTLLNDATVAFLEWSGGRSPSLLAQALAQSDDSAFRSRASAGATYTAPAKLSVTLEYEYNGAGLDQDAWDALRRGPASAYGRYRSFVANLQDPPTKHNLFWFARWQDALVVHLDMSALQRVDLADHSRVSWIEARYHWDQVDLALQWQRNSGDAGSDFGASAQSHSWQVSLTYFF